MIIVVDSGTTRSRDNLSHEMNVLDGGTANSTWVYSGGILRISSGGIANNTLISAGGSMHVSFGGTANSSVVSSGGIIVISSGGTANNTGVKYCGKVIVSSKAVLDSANVYASGSIMVESDGTANHTTMSGGNLIVSQGGIVNSTRMTDGGSMTVFDGGKANSTSVSKGGLTVSSGGIANYTKIFGVAVINSKAVVGSDGGVVNIINGGMANNTSIFSYGRLQVYSGGTAVRTTVSSGGVLAIYDGGSANVVTLWEDGYMSITSASVDSVYVNGGRSILSGSGLDSAATLDIGWGAVANSTTVNAGRVSLRYGTANNVVLRGDANSYGNLYISLGGIANNVIMSGGNLLISSGGQANNVAIESGLVRVCSYGIINGMTVSSGGKIVLDPNAKLTGQMVFASNALVSADSIYRGTNIDFDLTQTAPNGGVLVSNISAIQGNFLYTLTVSDEQKKGVYSLATNASKFYSTISIVNTKGIKLGMIGIGETIMIGEAEYTLNLQNGLLSLQIEREEIDLIAPTVSNIKASPTGTTKGAVTVTAVFADDVGLKSSLYRIGETGAWTAYENCVTVAENTTIFFKAVDTSGNESQIASYTVNNIENKEPEITFIADDGTNDWLWTKTVGWNDENIQIKNAITGKGEIHLDSPGIVDQGGYHNLFGNDGKNTDTGDVAHISVARAAKLTFTIDSTAAGTFYVYQDGVDKKGNRKLITVGKVSVKAGTPTTLKDICLTGDGKYYVAMTAKNVKKAGTEGLYNVNVIESKFFVDADDGSNNTAAKATVVEVGRGTSAVVLDSSEMTSSTEFANFVGFSDSIDYAKLDLTSSAYMSFNVKATGASKFTIWKQDAKGKLSKVSTTSLIAKKGFTATTAAKFLDTSKYTYYVSMASTDAAKGGSAYYNVEVSNKSVFFDSADIGLNNVLYDKKAKAFKSDANFLSNEISAGSQSVLLDDGVEADDFDNFVGYGDAIDFAKIELASAGNLSFTLEFTGDATFTVYKKGEKKGKEVLKTIQTTKLSLAKDGGIKTTNLLSGLDAGEYYISMAAKNTKATDKGCVFYNVSASFDVVNASALADVSGLDNKLGMQNGGLLA